MQEIATINQAVKNNKDKFLDDFSFQLNDDEFKNLWSNDLTTNFSKARTNPKAFTEQGVYMLATILKSKIASQVTVSIIRTFANMRQLSYEIKSDENFNKIFKALESKDTIQKQGIFYNGQIFDAHNFVSDLVRSAKKSTINNKKVS